MPNGDGTNNPFTLRDLQQEIRENHREIQTQLRDVIDRFTRSVGQVGRDVVALEKGDEQASMERRETREELRRVQTSLNTITNDVHELKGRPMPLGLDTDDAKILRVVIDHWHANRSTMEDLTDWFSGHGLFYDRVMMALITAVIIGLVGFVVYAAEHHWLG